MTKVTNFSYLLMNYYVAQFNCPEFFAKVVKVTNHIGLIAIEKEAFGSPSTTVAKFWMNSW